VHIASPLRLGCLRVVFPGVEGPAAPFRLRSEWAVNMHRDTFASYIGHSSMTAYFSIAENEAVGRCAQPAPSGPPLQTSHPSVNHRSSFSCQTPPAPLGTVNRTTPPPPAISGRYFFPAPVSRRTKYQMLQKMVVPCGLPPVKGGATEA